MSRRVIAYDFDGTITNVDTFPAFIHFAIGGWKFYTTFILFAPLLILMKLKLSSADKTKERIFSFVFKGVQYSTFTEWCQTFAKNNKEILRPKAMQSIAKFQQEKDTTLYIVSAGIKEWITPFFEDNQFTAIIATEIEVDGDGKLTGRFKSKNCNRSEKVSRLLQVEPNRSEYELIVFGDSSGDKDIIEFAEVGYYNKFV
ncbi:MAG: HAD family hydrolase [Rikenellaceae bacterium]